MKVIKKLPRLFYLNILWLLSCLPVLTIGASTCAAYAVALRLADDDEEVKTFRGIAVRFFKAFKQDLFQGFFMFLFTLACGSLGYFLTNCAIDYGLNLILIALLVIYAFVAFVFNFYAYPLIARYSNTFLNIIRNALALYIMNTKVSFRTMMLVTAELAVLYLTRYAYYIGFIILPALIFYTVSLTAKDIFVNLENRNSAPLPDSVTDSAEDKDTSTDADA